ncbi:MAG TPA: hypothetical protein VEL76_07905 [Gemmataceae bacterium]|nr:hypothetical protein [Gemmataceae bacterium]
MLGATISNQELPPYLLPSNTGHLSALEVEGLWEVFVHIGQTWGAVGADPLYQRSQWLEFLQVKTEEAPSYLEEYRSALAVLAELREVHSDGMWQKLFFEHGTTSPPTTRLAHLRTFVVEEFIKVWLTSGGFKTYGAGNYNSYVSGSRFAVRPPYRRMPSESQTPSPQTEALQPPQEG